jgi:hypothetical protein
MYLVYSTLFAGTVNCSLCAAGYYSAGRLDGDSPNSTTKLALLITSLMMCIYLSPLTLQCVGDSISSSVNSFCLEA